MSNVIKEQHVEHHIEDLAITHMHLHDCEMLLRVELEHDLDWLVIKEALFRAQARIKAKMAYWHDYEPCDLAALAQLESMPGIDNRNATNT